MHIAEGTIVDNRFRIGAPLGSGAMGSVYEARQLDLDRDVAIKFLLENAMFDPEDITRFHREAQLLSTLSHRNIVQVYAFGKWSGLYYMVIERIDGTSLDSFLKRKEALGKTFVLDVALQVCDGLAAAHAKDIVHRDIKPSNIIIAKNGDAKIIDFGFAKVASPTSPQFQQLTEAGTAIGTVLYMSPEQCRGESADHRADIYSLGAMLHHCLTGHPPFTASDYLAVMRQQLADPVPRLKDVAPAEKFSEALQNVVDNAMAKNRSERYQSIRQMREDIERAKKDQAVIRRTMTSSVPVLPQPKRKAKPIALAVFISSISSVGVLFYFAHHPGQPHSVADESKDMMSALDVEKRRILNRIDEPHTPLQEANLWADLAETNSRMAEIADPNRDKKILQNEAVKAVIEAVRYAPFDAKWMMFTRLGPVLRTPEGEQVAPALVVTILNIADARRTRNPAYTRDIYKQALNFSNSLRDSAEKCYIQGACMGGMLVCDRLLDNRSDWKTDIEECVTVALGAKTPTPDSVLELVSVVDCIGALRIAPQAELQIAHKLARALNEGGDFNKDYHQLAQAHVLTCVGLMRNNDRTTASELMKHGQKFAYLSPNKADLATFKKATKQWGFTIPEYQG